MLQLRRCLRVLCLCGLVMLLVLIARQAEVSKMTAISIQNGLSEYLGRRSSVAATSSSRTNLSDSSPADELLPGAAPLTLSTAWRSGYDANNGTFRVTFPRLYNSLVQLPDKPVPINFTTPAGPGIKACQRPNSLNVADELLVLQQQRRQSGAALSGLPIDNQGALWAPRDCWPPLSRTAVIVPYRNRSENLDIFIPYMYNLLKRQNILFGLFVVEQANTRLFNRAKLLNIGFRVSQQFHPFDCFIFQDADKVPENVANVYDCANSPKLMISEMRSQADPVKKYRSGRLYTNFFGGTVAITRDAFQRINGNSNRYYGWGREDDELAARLSLSGMSIRYNSGPDCRFVNLRHGEDIVTNTMPWPYAHHVRQTMAKDGLNSLNYTDMGAFRHPMFMLVRVDC